jgi:hypothetical protein
MDTTRRTAGLLAVGLAAAVALGACGIGGQGEDGASGDEAPVAAPREDSGAGSNADAGGQGEEAPDAPGTDVPDAPGEEPAPGGGGGTVVDQTRSIIYTGWITVRVTDVDAAATQAATLAARLDGFVGGDDRYERDDGAHAVLVLRIPSADFTAAVDELGTLGEEESRQFETEDVTEAVVDVAARVATAQASVDRTRTLLAEAQTIAEIISVESELSRREANLASLQARQRELADLTTLSTITVELLSPDAQAQEPAPGFVGGLKAGVGALLASVGVLLTVLGFLLPWLVVLAVPVVAWLWWRRRHRAPRVTPQPDTPAV